MQVTQRSGWGQTGHQVDRGLDRLPTGSGRASEGQYYYVSLSLIFIQRCTLLGCPHTASLICSTPSECTGDLNNQYALLVVEKPISPRFVSFSSLHRCEPHAFDGCFTAQLAISVCKRAFRHVMSAFISDMNVLELRHLYGLRAIMLALGII